MTRPLEEPKIKEKPESEAYKVYFRFPSIETSGQPARRLRGCFVPKNKSQKTHEPTQGGGERIPPAWGGQSGPFPGVGGAEISPAAAPALRGGEARPGPTASVARFLPGAAPSRRSPAPEAADDNNKQRRRLRPGSPGPAPPAPRLPERSGGPRPAAGPGGRRCRPPAARCAGPPPPAPGIFSGFEQSCYSVAKIK